MAVWFRYLSSIDDNGSSMDGDRVKKFNESRRNGLGTSSAMCFTSVASVTVSPGSSS